LDPQAVAGMQDQGVLLLALRDGGQVHLFAYHPDLLALTRLTDSAWDEIHPAISPDGKRLAYSSRENGYWDLYIRDLESGHAERITDTPEYEGSPSWSPDGVATFAHRNDNLDIYVLSLSNRDQAASNSPMTGRGQQPCPVARRAQLPWPRRPSNISWRMDARSRLAISARNRDRHPSGLVPGRRAPCLGRTNRRTPPDGLVRSNSPFASIAASQTVWWLAGLGPQRFVVRRRTPSIDYWQLCPGLGLGVPHRSAREIYGMQWISGPLTGWLWDAIQPRRHFLTVMAQPVLSLFWVTQVMAWLA
jgi:TolB protein